MAESEAGAVRELGDALLGDAQGGGDLRLGDLAIRRQEAGGLKCAEAEDAGLARGFHPLLGKELGEDVVFVFDRGADRGGGWKVGHGAGSS